MRYNINIKYKISNIILNTKLGDLAEEKLAMFAKQSFKLFPR